MACGCSENNFLVFLGYSMKCLNDLPWFRWIEAWHEDHKVNDKGIRIMYDSDYLGIS